MLWTCVRCGCCFILQSNLPKMELGNNGSMASVECFCWPRGLYKTRTFLNVVNGTAKRRNEMTSLLWVSYLASIAIWFSSWQTHGIYNNKSFNKSHCRAVNVLGKFLTTNNHFLLPGQKVENNLLECQFLTYIRNKWL